MTNEKIEENFLKCINWIKERTNSIGTRPLHIGWGNQDYMKQYEFSLQINEPDDPNVLIIWSGLSHSRIYGYEQKDIDSWKEEWTKKCVVPRDNRHTLTALSIQDKEKFLLDWYRIKSAINVRISDIESLNDFEV